jgi:hypothetical protein
MLTPIALQSRGGHKVLTQELFIRLDRKVFAGRLSIMVCARSA